MGKYGGFIARRDALLWECDRLEELTREVSGWGERTDVLLDSGESPESDVVIAAIADARRRIDVDMVEVGVFGEVGRGKSTLLNALLGVEVSSMAVTSETAVPVWVERGDRPSTVLWVDGVEEEFLDFEQARDLGTHRGIKKAKKGNPTRIRHWVNAAWLPAKVRLIDTPGLDDPELGDAYEALVLAELERVAAAVFVFSIPPTLAVEERKLLRSLGARGIDKVFLVCNMWPEPWSTPSDHEAVVEQVKEAVLAGRADGGGVGTEVTVYLVNARDGLSASLVDDDAEFEASGVAALRNDLETYLVDEVFERLARSGEHRLDDGFALLEDRLRQRVKALIDPAHLQSRIADLETQVSKAGRLLDEAAQDGARELERVEHEAGACLRKPFDRALNEIGSVRQVKELESLERRVRVEAETAASEASGIFNRAVGALDERLRRKLYDAFGIDQRLKLRTDSRIGSRGADLVLPGGSVRPDSATVAAAAAVTGVTTGIVGGGLAGGLGIALLAAGPVGWLVGAGVGLLVGVLGGGGAALVLSKGIKPEVLTEIRALIAAARRDALSTLEETCARIRSDLSSKLETQREGYIAGEESELRKVAALLADDGGRRAAVQEAEALLAKLVKQA